MHILIYYCFLFWLNRNRLKTKTTFPKKISAFRHSDIDLWPSCKTINRGLVISMSNSQYTFVKVWHIFLKWYHFEIKHFVHVWSISCCNLNFWPCDHKRDLFHPIRTVIKSSLVKAGQIIQKTWCKKLILIKSQLGEISVAVTISSELWWKSRKKSRTVNLYFLVVSLLVIKLLTYSYI